MRGVPEIERYAKQFVEKIVDRTYSDGAWLPEAWDVLYSALLEEASLAREAGPCAILVCERLVVHLVAYLGEIHEPARAKELSQVLMTGVSVAPRYLPLLATYSEEEREAVFRASVRTARLRKKLDDRYPDTR